MIFVKEICWNARNPELVFPCRETLDKKERLVCQDNGDDDIAGETQLRDDQPKEERTQETVEGARLESQVPDPTSSVPGQGPPSPLIPQGESPRESAKDQNASEIDEDELPYPYGCKKLIQAACKMPGNSSPEKEKMPRRRACASLSRAPCLRIRACCLPPLRVLPK